MVPRTVSRSRSSRAGGPCYMSVFLNAAWVQAGNQVALQRCSGTANFEISRHELYGTVRGMLGEIGLAMHVGQPVPRLTFFETTNSPSSAGDSRCYVHCVADSWAIYGWHLSLPHRLGTADATCIASPIRGQFMDGTFHFSFRTFHFSFHFFIFPRLSSNKPRILSGKIRDVATDKNCI